MMNLYNATVTIDANGRATDICDRYWTKRLHQCGVLLVPLWHVSQMMQNERRTSLAPIVSPKQRPKAEQK
jgi:hypothetical protein